VKSDDRTMPDIASDRMTAILSMVDSLPFLRDWRRLIVGHEARDAAAERRGTRHLTPMNEIPGSRAMSRRIAA